MKWSEEETLKFVKLYRDHECLWNMTKMIYRNRSMRQKAINNIMHEMGREGFGAGEIRQKIKNLRSTYNQELLKIKNSINSGTCSENVYKPAVKWFYIMNHIMKGAKEPSKALSNLDSQVEVLFSEEEKETIHEPKITEDEQQARLTQSSYEEASKSQLSQPTRIISSNAGEPNKGSNRQLDDLSQTVNELHTFNQIITQPESYMQENEAFGRYVISALNNLPQRQAILAQNDIQNILTRYRLDIISAPSTSSNTKQ